MRRFCTARPLAIIAIALSMQLSIRAEEIQPKPQEAATAPEEISSPSAEEELSLEEIVVHGELQRKATPLTSRSSDLAIRHVHAIGRPSLIDALHAIPGVLYLSAGGLAQPTTMSVRGYAPSNLLVLYDGVIIGEPGAPVDLQLIPSPFINTATLFLESSAARFSTGSAAGALLLETRGLGKDSAQVQLSGGSYGSASLSALLAPTEDVTVGISHSTTNGRFEATVDGITARRDNNDASRTSAVFRSAFGPQKRVLASALFTYHEGGLAGTVFSPTPDARQKRGILLAGLSLPVTPTIAPGEPQNGALTLSTRLARSSYSNGALGVSNVEQEEKTATAMISTTTKLGSELTSDLWFLAAIDDLNRDSGAVSTALPALDKTQFRGIGSAQLEYKLSSLWSIDGALGGALAGGYFGLSPRLGSALAIGDVKFSVQAGYAYRPPTFQERFVVQGTLLANPDLSPEKSLQSSARLSYNRDSTSISFGGHWHRTRGLIQYELSTPTAAKPINIGVALISGGDVSVERTFFNQLTAGLRYAYLSAKNDSSDPTFQGGRLPQAPSHQLGGHLSLSIDTIVLRAQSNYRSRMSLDRLGTRTSSGRTLLDIDISIPILAEHRIFVDAGLLNILDSNAPDFDGYPIVGRNVFLGMHGTL